ncbi:hypothetical protein MNBD_GAMMA02-1589 [hydrothermal vent metagenome]|uniref:Transposase IS200-like domain-containing protein n=1 Tax=hydrothermal vent metagenome TaxID=652676 RepID=A0A3B0WST1_9ZZZZ
MKRLFNRQDLLIVVPGIKQHAQNIELDAFVVMPNHVHGIIILHGNDAANHVETRHALSKTISNTKTQLKNNRLKYNDHSIC